MFPCYTFFGIRFIVYHAWSGPLQDSLLRNILHYLSIRVPIPRGFLSLILKDLATWFGKMATLYCSVNGRPVSGYAWVLNDWMRESVSEWLSEWVSEWGMSEWMSESVRNWLIDLSIIHTGTPSHSPDRQCVVMSTGVWSDVTCSSRFPYICSRPSVGE